MGQGYSSPNPASPATDPSRRASLRQYVLRYATLFFSFFHYQERAAEASAARLRSVERLVSGKESSAAVAANDDDDDEPKKARKRERRASKNLRAAELLPVEDSTEAGLASEEPPSAVSTLKCSEMKYTWYALFCCWCFVL